MLLIMKKIKIVIEKPLEKLMGFSIDNLNEIFGGSTYSCYAGATLTCTPFSGVCLSVMINGGDVYYCREDATLKKAR